MILFPLSGIDMLVIGRILAALVTTTLLILVDIPLAIFTKGNI